MSFEQLMESSERNWLIYNNGRRSPHIFTDNAKSITKNKFLKSFIFGIIAGTCFAHIFIFTIPKFSSFYKHNITPYDYKYDQDRLLKPEEIDVGSHLHSTSNEDRKVAEKLFHEVRVLCWVMTSPENHKLRGEPIKNTWGKRCNKLIFMSSVEDTELGAVALPVSEGRDNLWAKTKEAFKYIYKHHLDEYDWFMKADDDTYVVVENLRKMLYEYSTDYPIHLGYKFKVIVKQGYMSGGAGYVLSREALKRFIEQALPDKNKCRQDAGGSEDAELGKCMENVEVLAGDSRDEYERGRMFPFTPDEHLFADPLLIDYWYWHNMYYKSDEGLDCCSDHAVSFHYVQPKQMYLFDYLIYQLRLFGITPGPDVLPQKKSLNDVMSALYNSSNKSSQ